MFSKAKHLPILMYHSVAFLFESPFPNAVRIRPSIFAKQIQYLKDHRYHVVDLDFLFQWVIEGKELSPKTIALTLDDGYLDNYVNAYPILKFYGFPATVFLVTRNIGQNPKFMTWEQAREMEKNGIRFGNHTATHL
ncbi:MAG: polysaccharide deacetylase family protein, partial [Deltaproteobacteria bacterium]|nr:polysaccharide deacetylase family protein [Deltaproteobacteria bacterium]